MISPLEMTLFLLLASVAGVVLFRVLNLPPMLGYLTVGIVVGPNAFGLIPDSAGGFDPQARNTTSVRIRECGGRFLASLGR